jgi:hypothetical protein
MTLAFQTMKHSLDADGDKEDTYQNPTDNLTE